jgi:hypothetical protein
MQDCNLAGSLEKNPPPKKRTFSFFLFPGPRAQIKIIPLSWPDWWWGKGLDSVQKEGEGKRKGNGKRKII